MYEIHSATDRAFYHSFPRIRQSDTAESVEGRGLKLLEMISNTGLILAPEVVEWSIPLQDGSTKIIAHRQIRICFTELSMPELSQHSKVFGPFSVGFSISFLRQLGALPVIYVPQMLRGDRLFSSFGPMMVWMFEMVRHTLDQLHTLSQLADPKSCLEITQKTNPEAVSVDPNYKLNLTNTTADGSVDQIFEIEAKSVKGFLNYLNYKTAPFKFMRGAISAAQTLFYPTDHKNSDDLLSYYRQREWRIIPGLTLDGVAQVRPATNDEKDALLKFDDAFWMHELKDDRGNFRRIEEAYVLDEFQGKRIAEGLRKQSS